MVGAVEVGLYVDFETEPRQRGTHASFDFRHAFNSLIELERAGLHRAEQLIFIRGHMHGLHIQQSFHTRR